MRIPKKLITRFPFLHKWDIRRILQQGDKHKVIKGVFSISCTENVSVDFKSFEDFKSFSQVAIANGWKFRSWSRVNRNPHKVKIYDTTLAIEAVKGRDSLWPGEKFRHDFDTKSKASIYGLEDGSILIKSSKGRKLWKNFDYDEDEVERDKDRLDIGLFD